MKKIYTGLVLVFLFSILAANVHAGCGGPKIGLQPFPHPNWHYVDTVYIMPQDSIFLYSDYEDQNSCCQLQLGWDLYIGFFKDSNPHPLYASHQILVTEPGVYTVDFVFPGHPGGPNPYGGKIVVLRADAIVIPFSSVPVIEENSISIYPNPVSDGMFTIDLGNNNDIQGIEILSMEGSMIAQINPTGVYSYSIYAHDYRKGLYVVRIHYPQSTITRKIVIN